MEELVLKSAALSMTANSMKETGDSPEDHMNSTEEKIRKPEILARPATSKNSALPSDTGPMRSTSEAMNSISASGPETSRTRIWK